jgi:hypothetical protein
MITQIENLPDSVLGFEFSGHITAKEYETTVFPAIAAYSKQHPKMRLICHFKDDAKVDLGAMWDDTVVGLKHYFGWERIAVVSDINWLKQTYRMLGFLMPGHLKTFTNQDIQLAKNWLTEKNS